MHLIRSNREPVSFISVLSFGGRIGREMTDVASADAIPGAGQIQLLVDTQADLEEAAPRAFRIDLGLDLIRKMCSAAEHEIIRCYGYSAMTSIIPQELGR